MTGRALAALGIMLASACPAVPAPFRVGRAAVDMTPPTGPGQRAAGVHDRLHVKALVLEQDGAVATLVVLDLAVLRQPLLDAVRARITARTGIASERVLLSPTHTHSSFVPGELGADFLDGTTADAADRYFNALADKVADAVANAQRDLQPARIRAGFGREPSLIFNRRFLLRDNTTRFNPGFLNPAIVRPLGPVDPAIGIVTLERPDGSPLAVLVNYALHLDTVGGNEVSADYPHTLSTALSAALGPDVLTMFSIAAAGNINHFDVSRPGPQKGHGEAARIGTVLAGAVLRAHGTLPEVPTAPPIVRRTVVEVPVPATTPTEVARARELAARLKAGQPVEFMDRVWMQRVLFSADRAGQPLPVPIQTISVGPDLAWVGLPGEIFVEFGLALRDASPFRITLLHSLAGHWMRYVPNRKGAHEGAYEAINTRLAPGGGEQLLDAALRLLTSRQDQPAP